MNYTVTDRAVAATLAVKIWAIVSVIVGLYFVSVHYNPEEQGYFYTFQSLIAVQVLFDFGLSASLIQFVAHEKAQLNWQSDGTLGGSILAKFRLSSILKLAVKWYSTASVLMFLFIATTGTLFFYINETPDTVTEWRQPWLLFCVFLSLSLLISPLFSIIEGCGKITEIATFRLGQEFVSSIHEGEQFHQESQQVGLCLCTHADGYRGDGDTDGAILGC